MADARRKEKKRTCELVSLNAQREEHHKLFVQLLQRDALHATRRIPDFEHKVD